MMNETEVVMILGHVLSGDMPKEAVAGWEIEPLDIGEINVTTKNGQRFRLVIETPTEP